MARSRSVAQLVDAVAEMPPGYARTSAAEEAVRLADAANDLDAGFLARQALFEAAQHGGEPQKAMVAITWCLAQLDAHPGRFDAFRTLWALKWLPFTLLDVPDVPLADIEAVVAEAARRYTAEGVGEDAVAKLAWTVPLRTGRVAEAVTAHRQWRLVPRTDLGDCRACDVASEVDLALAAGDRLRAVDVARPLVAGRLDCAEQPAAVLADLLDPLLGLGRVEEAERLHQWGLRLAHGNPSLVAAQAMHARFLLRRGRLQEARELVRELLEVCDRGLFSVRARMTVLAVAAAVAAGLRDQGVPTVVPGWGDRPQDTAVLADQLAGEAVGIAERYDRRDGTQSCSTEVRGWVATRPDVTAAATQPPASVPSSRPAPAASAVVPVATPPVDAQALLTRARTPRGPAELRLEAAQQARALFLQAGDAAGAARALAAVGEGLVRLDRHPEAREPFTAAFEELAGQPEEQVRVALELARLAAGEASAVTEEARRWRDRAAELAAQATDVQLATGRVRLLDAEWEVLDLGPDAGVAAVGRAAAGFAEARRLLAADPARVRDTFAAEAASRAVVGDLDGALAAARQGWEDSRARADEVGQSNLGGVYASLLLEGGRTDQALEVLGVLETVEVSLDDPEAAAQAAAARCDLLREADRTDEALAAAWRASDLFAAAGELHGAGWARLAAARLSRERGNDLDAYHLYAELVERAAEDGDAELEGAVALDLAGLTLDYGELDEALAFAERARSRFTAEDAGATLRVDRVLAQVHDARQEGAAALAAGERCLAAPLEDEPPLMVADVRKEHADRLVVAGRPAQALELYALTRSAYAEAGEPVAVAAIDLACADALTALGRGGEAVALAEAAAAVGRREDEPALVADALWVAAVHSPPDAARYDAALAAYQQAGAPPEQLAELTGARDAALKRRSRWRR